jgi:hypothetical protein
MRQTEEKKNKKKATWVFSPKNFQLRRKIRDLLLLSILVQK